jgi:hypothetical protein
MSISQILYTVILEYGGGTYIAQVRSENPSLALEQWMRELSPTSLRAWKLSRTDLELVIRETPPMPLTGVSNVWCVIGTGQMEQILINIVATL